MSGRAVVVTGGSSGIGLATAELFCADGDSVLVVGRDTGRLRTAADEVHERTGTRPRTLAADVSTLDGVRQVVDDAVAAFGRLDVVFANAGTLGEESAPPRADEAAFDLIMHTNVRSAWLLCLCALPHMDGGAVVVTGSVSADRGSLAGPLYAASKAALRSLVRSLAVDAEILRRGVRVNAVTPGFVRTPLTTSFGPDVQPAVDEYVAGRVPVGRWGQAREVAAAVFFLAGDATYTTGSEFVVDGGLAGS